MHKSQVKTERLEPSQVGPNYSDKPKIQDPNRLEEWSASHEQCARETKARNEPEPGLGEAGRPLITCVGAKQLPLTSGDNQRRPRKGGGQMAASLGRPA